VKKSIALFFLAFCLVASSHGLKIPSAVTNRIQTTKVNAKDASVHAAKTWLTLIDNGKYKDSWNAASDVFKKLMPRDKWILATGKSRTAFGKLVSRNFTSATLKTALPGVSGGSTYVIKFTTKFQFQEKIVETVTLIQDLDGKWRVSAYVTTG